MPTGRPQAGPPPRSVGHNSDRLHGLLNLGDQSGPQSGFMGLGMHVCQLVDANAQCAV
jgi:hypothetical protein